MIVKTKHWSGLDRGKQQDAILNENKMIGKTLKWLGDKFETCDFGHDDELGLVFDIRFKNIYITICPDSWKDGWKARWNNLDKYFGLSFLTVSFDF